MERSKMPQMMRAAPGVAVLGMVGLLCSCASGRDESGAPGGQAAIGSTGSAVISSATSPSARPYSTDDDVRVEVFWHGMMPVDSAPAQVSMAGLGTADCTPTGSEPITVGDRLELLNDAGAVIAVSEGYPSYWTSIGSGGPFCGVDFLFDVPPGEPFLVVPNVDDPDWIDDVTGGVRGPNATKMFTVDDVVVYGSGHVAYRILGSEI